MDIKDRIREAFSKDKKKSIVKWDKDEQPNIYQLDNFLHKSGYRLIEVLYAEGRTEIILEPITSDHLHPDISHDVEEGIFYVDVKKYGLLSSSDVEEIIKGYNTSLGVLKHLDSLDLSKLEVEKDEDEE